MHQKLKKVGRKIEIKNRKIKTNLHERKGGGQDDEIQVRTNLRKS